MQSTNDLYFPPLIDDAGFDLGLMGPQFLLDLWPPPIEDFQQIPDSLHANPLFSADLSIFALIEDIMPAVPMPELYPFPSSFPPPMPQTNPHAFPLDGFLPLVAPQQLTTTNTNASSLAEAGSPPPQGHNLRSVVPTPTTPPRKARRVRRQRRMNSEEERIAFLQNDEDIESFTNSRATCSACSKKIKLDTRDGARFYVGAWVRHKECCKAIKRRNDLAGRRQESIAADERRTNL